MCMALCAAQHHHKDGQFQARMHNNGMGLRGAAKNKNKKTQSGESYYYFDQIIQIIVENKSAIDYYIVEDGKLNLTT